MARPTATRQSSKLTEVAKKCAPLWNRCSFILSKICIIVMFWARGLASEETYVDQVAQRESRPAKGDTRRRQVTSHAYLSNLADLFQVLSSIVKDCQRQVLSSIGKYCQVTSHACLSNLADLFQVLSFVYWVYSVLASLSPILRIVAFHNCHDYDDAWWKSTLLVLTKRGYHWRRSSGTWIKPSHLIGNFIVTFQAIFIGIVLSQFKFKAD